MISDDGETVRAKGAETLETSVRGGTEGIVTDTPSHFFYLMEADSGSERGIGASLKECPWF